MKTIFIPIFQGVEVRNILRTDVFKILKQQNDLMIVLFVTNQERKEYFEKEFFGKNIVYEVVPIYCPPILNWLFNFLKFNLIKTKTIDLKRKIQFEQDRNLFKYVWKLGFNRIFASKIFRKTVRFLDYYLRRDGNYSEYFEKYNPDLILSAHLFSDTEVSIIRQARQRGIKAVVLIISWDKITSRCMVAVLPDKLIVNNDIIKKEAIKFIDMKVGVIEVVGVPHYDLYLNKKSDRGEFVRKLGFSTDKKLVVFAPWGKERSDADKDIIQLIYRILKEDLAYLNAQLLVRFPPNDDVELGKDFLNKNIIYQKPGRRFSKERGVDWDMSFEDINELINTLYHSSLIISFTSSIAIDAAVFDKPVINIKFDTRPFDPSNRKPSRFYETEHYSKLLATGGVRLVHNENELSFWIKNYLENPETNSKERRRIIEEQCWKHDGRAGFRIANFILNYLNQ